MDENNQLGPAEVARIIGVTAMTVRRVSDKGELPFTVTPGGHRRYRRADVWDYCHKKGIDIQGKENSSTKILIVDDDEQSVMLLTNFVESAGNDVIIESALGGFEAGMKVKSFVPDVIVTDLVMPDLSGTKMSAMLKADPITSRIRVIGITGSTDEDEIREFLDTGADKCLRKPIKRKELLDVLGLSD